MTSIFITILQEKQKQDKPIIQGRHVFLKERGFLLKQVCFIFYTFLLSFPTILIIFLTHVSIYKYKYYTNIRLTRPDRKRTRCYHFESQSTSLLPSMKKIRRMFATFEKDSWKADNPKSTGVDIQGTVVT